MPSYGTDAVAQYAVALCWNLPSLSEVFNVAWEAGGWEPQQGTGAFWKASWWGLARHLGSSALDLGQKRTPPKITKH